MTGEGLILKREKGIATIIFNRPNVHNALNSAMVDGLEEAYWVGLANSR